MRVHREPGQIVGSHFTQSYLYGKAILDMPHEVPEPFFVIVDYLRVLDYGLTNSLQEGSCLILPANADLVEPLRGTGLPLFLDSCMREEHLAALRDVGRVLDGGWAENNYRDIARSAARENGPSIAVVCGWEWNNEEMQREFIRLGKHYSIGMPNRES